MNDMPMSSMSRSVEPPLGFRPEHAIDAWTLSHGYLEAQQNIRGLPLLAHDLAYLFWLSDRAGLHSPDMDQLDWESVIGTLEARQVRDTPETSALRRLMERFKQQAPTVGDELLWRLTAMETLRAWQLDQQVCQGLARFSYVQYLKNAVSSSAIPHLVATISLLQGLEMPSRLRFPRFIRVIRNLALASRLDRDLCNMANDRLEGRVANGVLVLEGTMPARRARAFVDAHRAECLHQLARDLDALGAADPYFRLVRAVLETQRQWYRQHAENGE